MPKSEADALPHHGDPLVEGTTHANVKHQHVDSAPEYVLDESELQDVKGIKANVLQIETDPLRLNNQCLSKKYHSPRDTGYLGHSVDGRRDGSVALLKCRSSKWLRKAVHVRRLLTHGEDKLTTERLPAHLPPPRAIKRVVFQSWEATHLLSIA